MSAILIGLTALGVGTSLSSGAAGRKDRKRQARANKAIAKLENARSRRRQVREARIQRGQSLAQGAVSGGGGGFGTLASSGTQGQVQSISSQLGSNLNYLDRATALSQVASDAGLSAANNESRANTAMGLANAAMTLNSIYSG